MNPSENTNIEENRAEIICQTTTVEVKDDKSSSRQSLKRKRSDSMTEEDKEPMKKRAKIYPLYSYTKKIQRRPLKYQTLKKIEQTKNEAENIEKGCSGKEKEEKQQTSGNHHLDTKIGGLSAKEKEATLIVECTSVNTSQEDSVSQSDDSCQIIHEIIDEDQIIMHEDIDQDQALSVWQTVVNFVWKFTRIEDTGISPLTNVYSYSPKLTKLH